MLISSRSFCTRGVSVAMASLNSSPTAGSELMAAAMLRATAVWVRPCHCTDLRISICACSTELLASRAMRSAR